ncbi:MAG: mannose-6-phosphate isomerase-like protein (cupin superfamily) [Pirellulaceae bacterium]|jgi:mannose-6-phosphate isomerase-like protein (cupin superfamily)
MESANWKTQCYGVIQSLLFNNVHRVIRYLVRTKDGGWQDRVERPAPAQRLYETETPPERSCLQTIQFVHHMMIPPGGRHVAELHVHPDAEELIVVTRGHGQAIIGGQSCEIHAEDVLYVPPGKEHEVRNTSDAILGVLFVNVPTGEGLQRLMELTK